MKITFSIILLLLSLLFLPGCDDKAKPTQIEAPRLVKTMTITDVQGGQFRVYPGRVSASQKVNLSFLVSGRLIELPIKEGEKVEKGQLLAQIDPKDYQIQVAQVKAKYDLAKITYERYEKLLPTDAISQSQYDEKKSLFDLSTAQYNEAKKALADASLYAPFTGIIARKYVDNFQFVQAKQNILSLQDFSELEILINIPEQDVAKADDVKKLEADKGKKTVGYASFAAIPNKQFPVSVKQVKTEADPQTQTYEVTLIMPLPKELIILPGMTASVKIEFGSKDGGAYYVPTHAVAIDENGKHYVWVVNKDNMTVEKENVSVGAMKDDQIKVLSGLKQNQTIVIAGVAYLQEGMKIKILAGRIGR